MKRDKKNNAFTDALGAELLSRKTLEKAKKAEEEQALQLDAFEGDLIADPIEPEKIIQQMRESEVKPEKKSKPKKKKAAIKKPVQEKVAKPAVKKEKTPAPSNIKVKAESEFEKRVFAEADSDFYDEQNFDNLGDNFRSDAPEKISAQSTFRSKSLEKKFEVAETEIVAETEEPPEHDPELYKKLSRVELAGVTISALTMIYSFINLDKPLFFLALSLFVHLIRSFIGGMCGKYNRAVQNGLRTFSLVLFVGAIIFLFMIS